MTWRDNLQPASIGGVTFHGKQRSLKGGRRIHDHEFPKREDNLPEDMGRKSRKFTVDGYLVGDDYMARRDRLIAVCERKGKKQYVDFWGRSQLVVVDDYEVSESQDEGRFCTIKLVLINAGGGSVPVAIAATAAQLALSAAGLQLAGVTAFAQGALVGQSAARIAGALGVQRSSLPASILNRTAGAPLRSY